MHFGERSQMTEVLDCSNVSKTHLHGKKSASDRAETFKIQVLSHTGKKKVYREQNLNL